MDDLISRQEAIDALNDELTITGKTNAIVVQDYIRKVNVRLNDLPSAEPERKKGRWLSVFDEEESKCSVCGSEFYYPEERGYNFCPNCGADLKGEQE